MPKYFIDHKCTKPDHMCHEFTHSARVKGGGGSGAPYGDQTSVAAGGRAMSDFSESEGANADVIERRRPGGHGGRAECSV